MPHVEVNGTRLYYEDTGGPGEPLLFSHGLLWSARMFEAQIAHFRERYRVVAWDHRGQGRSDDDPARSVPVETVTADALALMDRLEPPDNVRKYRRLALVARWLSLGLVTRPVMEIMYSKTFLEDPTRGEERLRWRRELLGNRRTIVRAVNGVVEREGVAEELANIRCQTTVIVGEEDRATVPAKAERIVAGVAHFSRHFTEMSSTSNTRSAPGGMTPPAPCAP